MNSKSNHFHVMEKYLTQLIFAGFVFFLIFLLASGYHIVWLKIICAIFSMLIPLVTFIFLFLTGEFKKKRSQWMVSASAALFLCTFLSLILNFPSPTP